MRKRYLILCLVLVGAALIASAWGYRLAPPQIVTHWNLQGQADGYGGPGRLFFIPITMGALLIVFLVLPAISPRRFKVDSFRSTYDFVVFLVLALLAYIHAVILWATLAGPIDAPRLLMAGLFLLLALVGNVLGKVRRNFWMGIRTPWTLASERVWRDTHRLAARLLFVVGPVGFVLALAYALLTRTLQAVRENRRHMTPPEGKTGPVNPGARSGRQSKAKSLQRVFAYHEETKHHFQRFARSAGYLDWENQPDPFRNWHGSPVFHLPLRSRLSSPSYEDVFVPGAVEPTPLSIDSLSVFFRNSLAISAWKRYGNARWALRVNPSSGNLHPTEGYALLPRGVPPLLPAGLYHYAPEQHAVSQRASAAPDSAGLPSGAFLVGLTSIHWRETWKYGERAYRYCQHDVGHAIAALRLSAAALGWRMLVLPEPGDADIAAVLGLDRSNDFEDAESEEPALLALVLTGTGEAVPVLSAPVVESWSGHASRLSAEHMQWPIIDTVSEACGKEPTKHARPRVPAATPGAGFPGDVKAETIFQRRRSAVAMDGRTWVSAATFFRILARTLPRSGAAPFDAFALTEQASPRVNLVLFVHRVDGLAPGTYMLVRQPDAVAPLRNALDRRFLWTIPPECPPDLPLHLLEPGDVQGLAAQLSCGQDIAGGGVFSTGMLAEFEHPIREIGPWFYRRLFWETGMIGQVLYLEAEAAGIRGTGIGCFFDDAVHQWLGLKDRRYQSLYHFTLGGAVDDPRLTTEPPYLEDGV
jgi:SagB-type dehydrogenase family enzyme